MTQTLRSSYISLGLVLNLNWDRLLYICTVFFALMLGAFLGSL